MPRQMRDTFNPDDPNRTYCTGHSSFRYAQIEGAHRHREPFERRAHLPTVGDLNSSSFGELRLEFLYEAFEFKDLLLKGRNTDMG